LTAARLVQPYCDAVDLNFGSCGCRFNQISNPSLMGHRMAGCPQGIAKRGHYGAFLMDEPETVYALGTDLADGHFLMLFPDTFGSQYLSFIKALMYPSPQRSACILIEHAHWSMRDASRLPVLRCWVFMHARER
jgi:hypothetical protein